MRRRRSTRRRRRRSRTLWVDEYGTSERKSKDECDSNWVNAKAAAKKHRRCKSLFSYKCCCPAPSGSEVSGSYPGIQYGEAWRA